MIVASQHGMTRSSKWNSQETGPHLEFREESGEQTNLCISIKSVLTPVTVVGFLVSLFPIVLICFPFSRSTCWPGRSFRPTRVRQCGHQPPPARGSPAERAPNVELDAPYHWVARGRCDPPPCMSSFSQGSHVNYILYKSWLICLYISIICSIFIYAIFADEVVQNDQKTNNGIEKSRKTTRLPCGKWGCFHCVGFTSAGLKSHHAAESHITQCNCEMEDSHITRWEVTSFCDNPNGTAASNSDIAHTEIFDGFTNKFATNTNGTACAI